MKGLTILANGSGSMGPGSSIAIWYNGRKDAKAKLHFNLWRFVKDNFKRGQEPNDILDIGIELDTIDNVNEIFVYFPFAKNVSNDITDLSHHLGKPGIATAIFNDRLTATLKGTSDHYLISYELTEDPYCFLHIVSNDEYSFDSHVDGTLLCIKEMALNRAKGRKLDSGTSVPTYFRLRIPLSQSKSHPLIQTIKPKDSSLTSGFETTEYIDFRLNESRNLPIEIARRMTDSDHHTFCIHRVDFLLAADISADLILGHQDFHKRRLLEPQLWENYIDCKIPSGMVIYHWKKDSPEVKIDAHPNTESSQHKGIKDFNAFVKLRIRRSSKKTILAFAFAAVFLGAVGSYAANYIPKYEGTHAKSEAVLASDKKKVLDKIDAADVVSRQKGE